MAEGTLKFADFFTYSEELYRFILINPYNLYVNPNAPPIRKLLGLLLFWTIFFSSVLFMCMQVVYLGVLISRTDDIAQIISSAAWIPVSLLAIEGILFTWRCGPQIATLIGILESGFPLSKEEQEFAQVSVTHQQSNRLSFIVNRTYFFALYICFFQNATLATIGYAFHGNWYLKMPRLVWYPFEYRDSYWRQAVVYLWECWGTTTTRAVVASAVFLGSLTSHICVQFDVLRRRFHELSPGRNGHCTEDVEKLIDLVREHNHLIDICEELGQTFKVTLLVNYVLSSVVVGCFGFLILNEPVLVQKMEYFFDLLCFMSFVSLFSFYGDLLTDRSRGVSSAIFYSPWIEANVKYKKDLRFVMARANRPFVLSGYFFFASYETYAKILASSYSYLALLLATYRKQR